MRWSWFARARRDRRGATRSRSAFASARSARKAARRRSRSRPGLSAITQSALPLANCPQWDNILTPVRRLRSLLGRALVEDLGGSAGAEHPERPRAPAGLAPPGAVALTEGTDVLLAAVGAVERHRPGRGRDAPPTARGSRPRAGPRSRTTRRRPG